MDARCSLGLDSARVLSARLDVYGGPAPSKSEEEHACLFLAVPKSTARGNPNKWLLTWLTRAFPSSSFLDGKDSKNSGIFLTGPNSHNNKVSVKDI